MKSSRVLYLLLSVLQFILFLKLIEVVRGEDVIVQSPASIQEKALNQTSQDGNGRGLFIAPKMKRKRVLRPWHGKSSDLSISSSNTTISSVVASDRISATVGSQRNETVNVKKDPSDVQSGRLCPGCENNECPITAPITSGFPVVPFIIAVIVGIKWFIIFLIIWIFFVRPDKHQQQSGYGAPQSGYGSGSGSQSDSSSFLDHIFEKIPFLHGHKNGQGYQRSLESYTSLLNLVLDSVGKLSDLYNSA